MIDYIEDRLQEGVKLIFVAKCGSELYNLTTHYSDVDWLGYCTTPDNGFFAQQVLYGNNDIALNDLGRFISKLQVHDVRTTELLYAPTLLFGSCVTDRLKNIIYKIWSIRDDIITMNLSAMYEKHLEEYAEHMKLVNSSDVPTYYMSKYLTHAYRRLDFPMRFASNNFKSYGATMRYKEDESIRDVLIDLKLSVNNHSNFKTVLKDKYSEYIDTKPAFVNAIDYATASNLKSMLDDLWTEVQHG